MASLEGLPSWIHWPNPPAERRPAALEPSPAKTTREPAVWRPMTDLERQAAKALGFCYLPPASCTKRMVRHLVAQATESEPRITDKQAFFLWKFAWTYRRQIQDGAVVREATRRRIEETGLMRKPRCESRSQKTGRRCRLSAGHVHSHKWWTSVFNSVERPEHWDEPEGGGSVKYRDKNGRVLFIDSGISGGLWWGTYYHKRPGGWSTKRCCSPLLPLRLSREDAQADLDAYATTMKWEAVP